MTNAWRSLWTFAFLVSLSVATSCGAAPEISGDGKIYYTQFPLRIDPRHGYRTTNFRTDQLALLPINSKVEIVGGRGRRLTCRLVDTGNTFVFEHVPSHTKDTIDEALGTVFQLEPVDLSQLTAAEQDAVTQGRVIPGMTAETVLIAIGPPPASLNLTLDAPQWIYQNTRWTKFVVHFGDDGCVASIEH